MKDFALFSQIGLRPLAQKTFMEPNFFNLHFLDGKNSEHSRPGSFENLPDPVYLEKECSGCGSSGHASDDRSKTIGVQIPSLQLLGVN